MFELHVGIWGDLFITAVVVAVVLDVCDAADVWGAVKVGLAVAGARRDRVRARDELVW
jgi:hypothetical protein